MQLYWYIGSPSDRAYRPVSKNHEYVGRQWRHFVCNSHRRHVGGILISAM